MNLCKCPNDGMVIRRVAEMFHGTDAVRFFWCWSCAELFAFVGTPGRLAAGFGWDQELGRWFLFRSHGTDDDVHFARLTVVEVGPQT
jgi:hypothetical protein